MDQDTLFNKGWNTWKQARDTIRYFLYKARDGSSVHRDVRDIHSIHFLCSGNICRSVFAELYARKIFQERGLRVESSSSGLEAKEEEGPPLYAMIAAGMFGINLNEHRPIKTDRGMVEQASLIACMHLFHYKGLTRRFHAHRDKYYLLKHLAWPAFFFMNTNDPYGKSLGEFIRTFHEIRVCIDIMSRKMNQNA
ncbi:MAG: tyrosine phosphatase [Euryarchaeota archaeon ADurb.Bin294]|nr:MAG: tyrosine phosphatase [Euryarchaeota archaeon ADurb.Bin294]